MKQYFKICIIKMEYIAKRIYTLEVTIKRRLFSIVCLFSYCRKEKEIMTTGRSMFSGNILRMELPLNPSVTMDGLVQFLSMGGAGFAIRPHFIEKGLTFTIPDNRGGVEYVEGFAVNTAKSRHVFYYI